MYRDQNIAKLKELGIYRQWKRNAFKARGLDKLNSILSDNKRLSDVIMRGFDWLTSKESSSFWMKIYCDQHNLELENIKENDKTGEN